MSRGDRECCNRQAAEKELKKLREEMDEFLVKMRSEKECVREADGQTCRPLVTISPAAMDEFDTWESSLRPAFLVDSSMALLFWVIMASA